MVEVNLESRSRGGVSKDRPPGATLICIRSSPGTHKPHEEQLWLVPSQSLIRIFAALPRIPTIHLHSPHRLFTSPQSMRWEGSELSLTPRVDAGRPSSHHYPVDPLVPHIPWPNLVLRVNVNLHS